ncbi:MAG: enoyl-CoA hydratase/isomerase family protein [Acidimicrobiales bacterium]
MAETTLERRTDGVAVVRLDRPKLNPLSVGLLSELEALCSELAADPPGAVVVWGGERCFSAGADVAELAVPGAGAEVTGAFHRTLSALAGLERATIAAITGYALGGGLELALACDLRFAADNARLGQPEILLGIIPGGGGTQRLARLVGPSAAKELILTGRTIRADEALALGLVNRVTSPETVFAEAIELAARLASGPLVAEGLAKRAVDVGLSSGLETGLALERRLFAEVLETEDAAEGMRSFREDGPGKARFSGR